jgi:hypothetical protein
MVQKFGNHLKLKILRIHKKIMATEDLVSVAEEEAVVVAWVSETASEAENKLL